MGKARLSANITKIHYQMKLLWSNVEESSRRHGYEGRKFRALLNNSSWYHSTTFIEVVHRLFKGMRMGPLLSRETVKRKMSEGDGMSLDEFVYPLLQAWDWWTLFKNPQQHQMQIGGSDQYGNIVSGVDAIKYICSSEPDPSQNLQKSRRGVE